MSGDWPAGGLDEFGPYLDQQLQDPEVRAAFQGKAARPEPHVLVVTEVDGKRWYAVECPGVTNDCRAWVSCDQFGRQCDDDTLDEDQSAHGVEHHWIDGDWMVPTDDCLARTHFYLAEVASDLNLPPGRHPVRYDFGDGSEFNLSVLDAAGAVP